MTHPNLVPIRRALISVSDKDGITDFAENLTRRGVELLSTGGTADTLREAGVKVVDVSDYTGFPEMMGGRVKTLHPKVHGGILALRDNTEHQLAMKVHRISPIDLVVVNLYPFEKTVAAGADYDEAVEKIDIGGPAMLRSAAKNHEWVVVVTNPQDYTRVMEELSVHDGCTTFGLRQYLAEQAFAATTTYDLAIRNWFSRREG